jgi:hypothetical protein
MKSNGKRCSTRAGAAPPKWSITSYAVSLSATLSSVMERIRSSLASSAGATTHAPKFSARRDSSRLKCSSFRGPMGRSGHGWVGSVSGSTSDCVTLSRGTTS